MPMESAFRRNYEAYRQILDSLQDKNNYSQEYQEFLDSISALNETITQLSQPRAGENGLPTLTAEELTTLKQAYDKAQLCTNSFIGLPGKSKVDDRRSFIAEEFLALLIRDQEAIKPLQDPQGLTLPGIFRHARSLRLDITGSPTGTVGNYLSSRVPVTYKEADGTVQKGFFTKSSAIETEDQVIRRYQEAETEFPEFWDVIRQAHKNGTLMPAIRHKLILLGCDGDPFQRHPQQMNWLGNERLGKALQAFQQDYIHADHYKRGVRATPGSSLEERNCAMTQVADLLGRGHLLARAQKVTLVNGGEVLHGCIMEQAVGSDRDRLTANDPMRRWAGKPVVKKHRNEPVITNPPAISNQGLKQLADLQILDYLCGNTDRHTGNMLYRFRDANTDHPVLDSVIGIDNDASFGTYQMDLEDGFSLGNAVPLEMIQVISRSMADRVMNLTGAGLDYALQGFRLSPEERLAARKRLATLQETVLEGLKFYRRNKGYGKYDLEPGQIRIVPDEEFDKLDREDLERGENYFQRVHSLADRIITNPPTQNELAKAEKGIAYAGGVIAAAPANRSDLTDRFRTLHAKLRAAKHNAAWNSSEFKDMYEALKALANPAGQQDLKALQDALHQVQEKTRNYISAKREVPKTDKGRARLHLARELADLCEDADQELVASRMDEEKPPVPTYREQMQQQLNARKETALADAKAALEKGQQDVLTEKISELEHLASMEYQLTMPGNGLVMQQLKPEALPPVLEALRPGTQRYLAKVSPAEILKLAEEPNLLHLHQHYLDNSKAPRPVRAKPAGTRKLAKAPKDPVVGGQKK